MAARFFSKIGQEAKNFFSKGGQGQQLLSKVSNTLGDASVIARKISNTWRDILANPLVEAGASLALGPEAGASMAGVNALLNNIGDVSKLSNQASNLTNASTYKGGTNAVSQDILQRATNLQGNANAIKQNIQNQSQNNFV